MTHTMSTHNLQRGVCNAESLGALINDWPDCVIVKDLDGRLISANSAYLRLVGAVTIHEIVGKRDFDLFPAELAAQIAAEDRQVLQSGEPSIDKLEQVIDGGKHGRLFLTTRLPLRDAEGQISGLVGILRDFTALQRREEEALERLKEEQIAEITKLRKEIQDEIAKRKRVETELTTSKEKYRTLFEESKDVVFISSPQGKFLDINRAGVELHGYESKEELLRINLAKELYVDPHQRAQFQKELEEKGFVKDFEMVLKRKDGQHIVVLETAIAVRNAKGEVIAYQGFTHDITERKRAVEALRRAHDELEQRVEERTAELATANEALQIEIAERKQAQESMRDSEEKYRTLFQESRDAIYITSRKGKIVEMNQSALDLFGYTREGIHGQNVKILYVDPNDRFKFQKEIEERGYVRDYEVTLKRKDGARIDCLFTSTIRWAKDGSILGYQGSIRDITERKKAEAELRSSRQTLRELSARLQAVREEEKRRIAREIHDEFGQPLTTLKIDLAWLSAELAASSPGATRKYARKNGNEKLLQKIESMLTRTDETIKTVQNMATELRPIVLDEFGLLAAIEWQAQEFESRSGIRCKISSALADTLVLDQSQATAVFRIFQETLTNVIRHASASEVVIYLGKEEGCALLQVKDNGKGISETEISSPKSLGLLGMRERAILLGGDISISGVSQQGTMISVRIPLERQVS